VNIELYQRRITNHLEAVDLASLDDEDISSAALEGFAAYCPNSTAFTNKLDLVIRMPVRTRPRTGFPWYRNTETVVSPCSAPTKLNELPIKGRFSWRT
jgi:hypothetical protein